MLYFIAASQNTAFCNPICMYLHKKTPSHTVNTELFVTTLHSHILSPSREGDGQSGGETAHSCMHDNGYTHHSSWFYSCVWLSTCTCCTVYTCFSMANNTL